MKCAHVHMYTMYTCTCTHVHVHVHMYMYMCTRMWVAPNMCTRMCVAPIMCTCMCVAPNSHVGVFTGDTIHKYPSSKHVGRDWDKLVANIKKEEKEEKPEGDAALQQLFQQIYKDGSDEVKKAMAKSFVSNLLRIMQCFIAVTCTNIASNKSNKPPPNYFTDCYP